MKVIILTESQVKKLITEQSELSFDRRYSTASAAEKSNVGNKQMVNAVINMDPHTRNAILAIGVAFIPVVGPALSMGVAAYDAKSYWNEGKKKEASLSLFLGLLPIISKIPVFKQLGAKGMSGLASKIIAGGTELTALENEVIQILKTNPKLLDAAKGYIKNKAISVGVDVTHDAVIKESQLKKIKDLKGNEYGMVTGIVDILKKVIDKDNRKKIADKMIKQFKRENIDFDYDEFMTACKLK
jgi:hypothetical protein